MHPIVRGLADSASIAVGYFPVAFSFGLSAVHQQLSPLATVLISLLVFAGASQFVLVALLAAGGSALSVVSSVILMNVRHIFYGPSLLPHLGQLRLPLPLLAFGLTDEVYASAIGRLTSLPDTQRSGWLLGLQGGAYSSWVLGTIAGALLGSQVGLESPALQQTLEFVLPALFFALLLEIMRQVRWPLLLMTLLVTALLLSLLPTHFAMLGGMLSGAALGALLAPPSSPYGQ